MFLFFSSFLKTNNGKELYFLISIDLKYLFKIPSFKLWVSSFSLISESVLVEHYFGETDMIFVIFDYFIFNKNIF